MVGPSLATLAKAEAMKSAIRATDGDSVAAEKKLRQTVPKTASNGWGKAWWIWPKTACPH